MKKVHVLLPAALMVAFAALYFEVWKPRIEEQQRERQYLEWLKTKEEDLRSWAARFDPQKMPAPNFASTFDRPLGRIANREEARAAAWAIARGTGLVPPRMFQAVERDGLWFVKDSLPEDGAAGELHAVISAEEGKVIYLWRAK